MPEWLAQTYAEGIDCVISLQQMSNPDAIGAMTADQVYDLVLSATGSEEKAKSLALARAKARQRMGMDV